MKTRRVTHDKLRFLIIALMVENAQVKAATGPVIHEPYLDVDKLGIEFDRALDEINEYRYGAKLEKINVDASFKQAVIDTMIKQAERSGRMMIG